MDKIIDEILSKMRDFRINNGKPASWIYLNHKHYNNLMLNVHKLEAYLSRSNFYHENILTWNDVEEKKPTTIFGMQYKIIDDLTEMEVQ